jgi:cytidylate kinase
VAEAVRPPRPPFLARLRRAIISIRTRLTLGSVAILALVLLAFSGFVYTRQARDLQGEAFGEVQNRFRQLEGLSRYAAHESEERGALTIPARYPDGTPLLQEGEELIVLSPQGQIVQKLGAMSDPEAGRVAANLGSPSAQESPKYYLKQPAQGATFKEYLEGRLKEFAQGRAAVIVGMGSQFIFAGDPGALHVRAIASTGTRIGRIRVQYHVSEEEAESILAKADKKHKRYVSALYSIDIADPAYYDLILNTDRLEAPECVRAILTALHERENRKVLPEGGEAQGAAPAKPPVFKNAAEEEFAGILDMYQMEWEYEPKTFPIEWDAEGNVTMAFSPDFYLKKFDTYIEITTMNQKYVTTKNKKVKRLRELYPGIHISIVYKNDFNSLISRFRSE